MLSRPNSQIAILLAGLLLSCNSSPVAPEEPFTGDQLFPVASGNRWKYTHNYNLLPKVKSPLETEGTNENTYVELPFYSARSVLAGIIPEMVSMGTRRWWLAITVDGHRSAYALSSSGIEVGLSFPVAAAGVDTAIYRACFIPKDPKPGDSLIYEQFSPHDVYNRDRIAYVWDTPMDIVVNGVPFSNCYVARSDSVSNSVIYFKRGVGIVLVTALNGDPYSTLVDFTVK